MRTKVVPRRIFTFVLEADCFKGFFIALPSQNHPKRSFDTVSESIIQVQHLNKTFGTGDTAVHALEDINLDI